jgi:hypothetical protein
MKDNYYFCNYCDYETTKKPKVSIKMENNTLYFCNKWCMEEQIKENDRKLKEMKA